MPLIAHTNKNKMFLFLFGSLIFVFVGLFNFIIVNKSFIGHAISIACIIFFGWASVIYARQIFDNKPILIIDDKGVLWNGAVSVGLVSWQDIRSVKIIIFSGEKMLSLCVTDPRKYLVRIGLLKQLLIVINQKLLRHSTSIVVLPQTGLLISLESIAEYIEDRIQ